MTKQRRGFVRRVIDVVRGTLGMPVTHFYPDPVAKELPKPKNRVPRARKPMQCVPGTIAYHDKLVRHFGRRRADVYGEYINRNFLDRLPTEQDFVDNPPWAWRAKRTSFAGANNESRKTT